MGYPELTRQSERQSIMAIAEQLISELDLNGEASEYSETVSQQRAFRLPLEAVSLVLEHESRASGATF